MNFDWIRNDMGLHQSMTYLNEHFFSFQQLRFKYKIQINMPNKWNAMNSKLFNEKWLRNSVRKKKYSHLNWEKKWMNEIISFSLVLQIDLMHTQTHVKNWYNGE